MHRSAQKVDERYADRHVCVKEQLQRPAQTVLRQIGDRRAADPCSVAASLPESSEAVRTAGQIQPTAFYRKADGHFYPCSLHADTACATDPVSVSARESHWITADMDARYWR